MVLCQLFKIASPENCLLNGLGPGHPPWFPWIHASQKSCWDQKSFQRTIQISCSIPRLPNLLSPLLSFPAAPVNAQGPLTGALPPPPSSAHLASGPSPDSCLLCSQGDRGSGDPEGCLGRLPCSYRGWMKEREGTAGGRKVRAARGGSVWCVRRQPLGRWESQREGRVEGCGAWGERQHGAPEEMERKAGRGTLPSSRGLCALLTCLRSWDGSSPRSVGPGSLGHRGRRRCPACSHRCPH